MDGELKENSDLLRKRSKPSTNGNLSHDGLSGPPDGGLRAFTVVLGSFLTNGLIFGVINSCSVIYSVHELHFDKDVNAKGRAALVGSLAMGIIFLLSPLSGILTSILGLRITAVLGGLIASTGMILSSFVPYNIDVLLFTYSFMYGLGASFAYTPSLAILGHYFKKHLGLVNGIVTIGSSVFTVIIPPVMELVIQEYGLEWLFRLLALFTFGIALCGLLFKPIPLMITKVPTEDKGLKGFLLTVIDVQIWQNKKYLIWALSMPVVLFGYFVPYVHIKSFIKENFNAVNESLPLQCIATASGMGRLIFGWLGDKPLNKILLQQISFYAIGVLTIILPFVRMFGMLIVISLGMGLFEGAFISLIGPIAFELCGRAHAAQAIGWMLGLSATTLSLGPPLAIYIHSYTSSYTIPFVLAGLSPIIGATLMFSLRYYRFANRNNHHSNGLATMPADIHIERPSSPGLLLKNGAANHQATL